jgi:hypothetical protein
MALSIVQTPATVSLAQSPIIFSLNESNTAIVASEGFQYVAELYYWTGSLTDSGSVADYTLTKYPNLALNGIFDLNRIINSTLTDLAQANTSSVEYFACDFYWQYLSGSTYTTGSHVKSSTYKALDGYGLFQEPIGQAIFSKTEFWPLMTDGPASQSVLAENKGTAGVYVGTTGGGDIPVKITYTSNLGTADFSLSATSATTGQIKQYPIGPQQSGFPLSTSGLTYFTVQPYAAGGLAIGSPMTYDIVCNQKYPNIRIKWKNRYGQFDWFNFNMVNRQSFNTERRTYQPQLGTWGASTLSYNNYDSSVLNYIADSKQAISVQTDWVDEAYNEIFKQLLVADEVYWIYDESTNPVKLRPITINTSSITFKTGVVDKVIQYSFDFNWGQAYKLII